MSQKLRPNFGFLRSELFAFGNGNVLPFFGTHTSYTQGRKPSLSSWMGSLANGNGIDAYSRINAALGNDNENPAVDGRSKCRSQRERFGNP